MTEGIRERAIEEVAKKCWPMDSERARTIAIITRGDINFEPELATALHFAERALRAEQRVAEAEGELRRLQDVVGEEDAEIIEQFLNPTAQEGRG